MNTFGDFLRALRIKNNLSQKELGVRCHCTQQEISLLENNKRKGSVSMIRLIASAIGVESAELALIHERQFMSNELRVLLIEQIKHNGVKKVDDILNVHP